MRRAISSFRSNVTLPALANRVEDERVLLVEPNEPRAEGTLRRIELDGQSVWFAEIGTADAIRGIYPDSPVETRRPAKAWRPEGV